MAAQPTPVKIRLDKPNRRLIIDWSDGVHSEYAWSYLRAHCPSAGEIVERDEAAQNPLKVLGRIPSNDLTDLRMVGNYALSPTWSDGHSAGIYTWEYLRQITP